MKHLVFTLILFCVIGIFTRCKFFEKQSLVSNDIDTLLNYERDSAFLANYISREEIKRIEENAKLKMDSLRQACKEEVMGTNNKYHVIVGSFKISENAENYLQDLEMLGYNPKIIELNNGFYLVSANSYSTLKNADTALAALRENITGNAWIYASDL